MSEEEKHPEALMLASIEDEIGLRLRQACIEDSRSLVELIATACGRDKRRLRRVEPEDLPMSLPRDAIVDAMRAPIDECMPVLNPLPVTLQMIERARAGRIKPVELKIDAASCRAFVTGNDVRTFIRSQIQEYNIRMVDALEEQRRLIEHQRAMLDSQRQTIARQDVVIDQLTTRVASLRSQYSSEQKMIDDDDEELTVIAKDRPSFRATFSRRISAPVRRVASSRFFSSRSARSDKYSNKSQHHHDA